MTGLSSRVSLTTPRIPVADGVRQEVTAAAILERLDAQPGVVLADEVGMGKTFVALAVAVSMLETKGLDHPVVVMIPPGVRDKWPREWQVFRELCLRGGGPELRATERTIERPGDFLKLFDDPVDRRRHIVFATHRALSNMQVDPWIHLALIRQSMLYRSSLAPQWNNFPRWAGDVLAGAPFKDASYVAALLDAPPSQWAATHRKHTGTALDDDPVPRSLIGACKQVDLDPVRDALGRMPLRESAFIGSRLADFKSELYAAFKVVWPRLLARSAVSSPLLILDEAHHLRHPNLLAQLFETFGGDEAPPLKDTFERMLFLTATPFQLGHQELIEVLRRFDAVRWRDAADRELFTNQLHELSNTLDRYRSAALRLDAAWARLGPEAVAQVELQDRRWWAVAGGSDLPGPLASAAAHAAEVRAIKGEVQTRLRPWVIRHTRDHGPDRREVLVGSRIRPDTDERPDEARGGLAIETGAVLPFLLAARAQAEVAASSKARALFADGLASSYEAYLGTRSHSPDEALDEDARDGERPAPDEVDWYLEHIDHALPRDRDGRIRAPHPKLSATVDRVVDLWHAGEKVVVFSFFVATGRALRDHIAHALTRAIRSEGAAKLGLPADATDEIDRRLARIGDRFFRADSPMRRTAEAEVGRIVADATGNGSRLADEDTDHVMRIALRFLRTPSFLVRYFDLDSDDDPSALRAALDKVDRSGMALRDKVAAFARFAADRVDKERREIFDALESLQTGGLLSDDPGDETIGAGRLPNVRLANGSVKTDTRRRLMAAFNTPFFPEVLVASAVLGEGVDLHLDCRHVIHHDLDWNPSVVEQRTGRVDRIGSKAESSGKPLVVFQPFVEGTQDEKQYRVLTDRGRWFGVLMGERLELDEAEINRLAARVPLPEELAEELTIRLEVAEGDDPQPAPITPAESAPAATETAPEPSTEVPQPAGEGPTLGEALPAVAAAPPELDHDLREALGTSTALRVGDVPVQIALQRGPASALAGLIADVLLPQSVYTATRSPSDPAAAFVFTTVLRSPIAEIVGALTPTEFDAIQGSAGTRLSNTLSRGGFTATSLNGTTFKQVGALPAAGYGTVRELLVHALTARLRGGTRAAEAQPEGAAAVPESRAAAALMSVMSLARRDDYRGSVVDVLAALADDPRSLSPELAAAWAELQAIQLHDAPSEPESAASAVPIETLLGRLLSLVPKRDREIFADRKLHGGARRTLQEIADAHNVTRERVRQLEARAAERVRTALERDEYEPIRTAAADLHLRLGSAVPAPEAEAATPGLGDEPGSDTHLHAALLLWSAGPYEQWDGWLVVGPAAELDDQTIAMLRASADAGVIPVEAATTVVENLGIRAEHVDAWLARFPRFRRIDEVLVEWPDNTGDRAEIVLRLAGRAMTTDELHLAVGGVTRPTLVNALGPDPRFTRTGLDLWELSDWGGEAYTTAIDMMRRLIADAGGETGVQDLARELSERFGLTEASTFFNASAPQFVTQGGRIRVCPDPAANGRYGDPATTRGMYRDGDGDGWLIRIPVNGETLRGSGSSLPTAAAREIGLRPTEVVTLDTTSGPLRASWPALNPIIGSLRTAAADFDATVGDHLLVGLSAAASIRVIRKADLDRADPLRHVALLVGVDHGVPDDSLIGSIASALDLTAASTTSEIAERLQARGETDLADLLPESAPAPIPRAEHEAVLGGLDPAEHDALLALCRASTVADLASLLPSIAAHAVALDTARRSEDEFIDAPLAQRIAEVLEVVISDPAATATPERRRLIRGAADYFVIDDDDYLRSIGLEDDARILNAVCHAVGRPDLEIPLP